MIPNEKSLNYKVVDLVEVNNFRIFWRWWASVFGRSGAVWSVGFDEDGWLGLVLVGSTRIVGFDPWAWFPAF